jgi:hypothetical protein
VIDFMIESLTNSCQPVDMKLVFANFNQNSPHRVNGVVVSSEKKFVRIPGRVAGNLL